MYKANGTNHIVNLEDNFFNSLQFDSDSLKKYRINAAIKCSKNLGTKPALLLSGGVDSQAMIQCFVEAKLNFDIITFVFNDELNKQDANYARFFCKMNNLKLIEYEFNVINFLQAENYNVGTKYKSISPHFNAHYKMAEILKEIGYTGIACGGFAPILVNDAWGTNFSYNTCHYTNIQETLGIPFQGNFLSYTPELAWSIGLLTEKLFVETLNNSTFGFYRKGMKQRYDKKLEGYKKHGFNLYAQSQKFTGFELIKKHYEQKTGDGWFFDKSFRIPLTQKFKTNDSYTYKFELSTKQINNLSIIYNKNFTSNIDTSTRISE